MDKIFRGVPIEDEPKSTHHDVKPTVKCPFKDRPCDKQCKAYDADLPGSCFILEVMAAIACGALTNAK